MRWEKSGFWPLLPELHHFRQQSCRIKIRNNRKSLIQIFHLSGKAFRLSLTCPSRPIALVFLAMALPHLKWALLEVSGSSMMSPQMWQKQMFYLLDVGPSHHSWVSVYVHSYRPAWDSGTSHWSFSPSLLLGVREIVNSWKRNPALL